ncbi:MAG: hypothetical protein KGJ13_10960, partial [Patescibacteria group bacterium]|nr:hypothetical protein [Patescibacteria group bacterium]
GTVKTVTRMGFECSACNQIFPYAYREGESPYPDMCPLCGAAVSHVQFMGKKRHQRVNKGTGERLRERANPAGKVALNFGIVSKSADQVYRQMEDASVRRQREAAELLGVHPSKLPEMKMTNMKDNHKAGEISYMPSSATKLQGSVVRMMPTASDGVATAGNFGGAQGQMVIPGQPPVSFSRPGAPVPEMQAITGAVVGGHSMRAAATAAAGKAK